MAGRIHENSARNHYAAYSLGAARAERNADYQHAASLWDKAANAARSILARFWAERRSEFCQSAADKDWGLKAQQFNQRYSIGTQFVYISIYQGDRQEKKSVKTIDYASDVKNETRVKINKQPYFVNINDLVLPN
ncbi:conserved hypothetical protein [Xenorhabdus bovienii str. oregonense]|uniref:ANR family transcriptional regulator n=1 Tax=Xenorhabdus bovienii str. oregonense TaxID=1398202 RepID=A0A077P2K2_XENBV|nr:ANR family transcriptional regulator [Xenorhabdus bovienii]CDH05014.1 conserved hypothetical protein [Xenorhabdus bovienii str. oregonense]